VSARRGSLTLTRLYVKGAPPKDLRKPFLAAIRLRAFQPLKPDDEASEASGWCVLDRPFDLDFDAGKVFEDRFVLLGFRIDRFRVPAAMVRAQLADEEQKLLSQSKRDRVSRNERLELRDKILLRLRRKIPPSTRTVDVVWDLDQGLVLFFSHSVRVIADFSALFEKTFKLELTEDSPYVAAERVDLPRALLKALDRVEPTSLLQGKKRSSRLADATPRGDELEPAVDGDAKAAKRSAEASGDEGEIVMQRIETTRFLGPEFILYLWVRNELANSSLRLRDSDYNVWLDQQLTLESPLDKNERVTVRGMAPADGSEAREAVRSQKLPVRARIVLQSNERDFAVGLVAPRLGIAGAKVPAVLTQDASEGFVERMHLVEELFAVLDALYRTFLLERLSDNWKAAWEPAIAAWVEENTPPPAVLKALQSKRRS
jgi:hypothetical protein